MGCCLDCCCPNANPKVLSIILLIFILIIFVCSIIAACYRIGPTFRYKQALKLLDQRNDEVIFKIYPPGCFKGFTEEELKEYYPHYNPFSDYNACIIGFIEYERQDKIISAQNLFKNCKQTELSLHIVIIIIAGISSIYLLFILLKYLNKNQNFQIANDSEFFFKFFVKPFYIVILLLSIMLFILSIVILFVVTNVSGTDHQIGLYKRHSDDLLNIVIINIIIGLINIFFSVMSFIFSFLVKNSCDRQINQQGNNNVNIIQYNNAKIQTSPQQNREIDIISPKKTEFSNKQDNGFPTERVEVLPNHNQNEN